MSIEGQPVEARLERIQRALKVEEERQKRLIEAAKQRQTADVRREVLDEPPQAHAVVDDKAPQDIKIEFQNDFSDILDNPRITRRYRLPPIPRRTR